MGELKESRALCQGIQAVEIIFNTRGHTGTPGVITHQRHRFEVDAAHLVDAYAGPPSHLCRHSNSPGQAIPVVGRLARAPWSANIWLSGAVDAADTRSSSQSAFGTFDQLTANAERARGSGGALRDRDLQRPQRPQFELDIVGESVSKTSSLTGNSTPLISMRYQSSSTQRVVLGIRFRLAACSRVDPGIGQAGIERCIARIVVTVSMHYRPRGIDDLHTATRITLIASSQAMTSEQNPVALSS